MKYTIPRGIKVKEVVAYGLNGKQMIYLAMGIGGAVSLFTLPLPLDFKIAGSVLSCASSVGLSLAKRHGQELDSYVWNTIKYPLRQKEWIENVQTSQGAIKVRYHTRKPSAI